MEQDWSASAAAEMALNDREYSSMNGDMDHVVDCVSGRAANLTAFPVTTRQYHPDGMVSINKGTGRTVANDMHCKQSCGPNLIYKHMGTVNAEKLNLATSGDLPSNSEGWDNFGQIDTAVRASASAATVQSSASSPETEMSGVGCWLKGHLFSDGNPAGQPSVDSHPRVTAQQAGPREFEPGLATGNPSVSCGSAVIVTGHQHLPSDPGQSVGGKRASFHATEGLDVSQEKVGPIAKTERQPLVRSNQDPIGHSIANSAGDLKAGELLRNPQLGPSDSCRFTESGSAAEITLVSEVSHSQVGVIQQDRTPHPTKHDTAEALPPTLCPASVGPSELQSGTSVPVSAPTTVTSTDPHPGRLPAPSTRPPQSCATRRPLRRKLRKSRKGSRMDDTYSSDEEFEDCLEEFNVSSGEVDFPVPTLTEEQQAVLDNNKNIAATLPEQNNNSKSGNQPSAAPITQDNTDLDDYMIIDESNIDELLKPELSPILKEVAGEKSPGSNDKLVEDVHEGTTPSWPGAVDSVAGSAEGNKQDAPDSIPHDKPSAALDTNGAADALEQSAAVTDNAGDAFNEITSSSSAAVRLTPNTSDGGAAAAGSDCGSAAAADNGCASESVAHTQATADTEPIGAGPSAAGASIELNADSEQITERCPVDESSADDNSSKSTPIDTADKADTESVAPVDRTNVSVDIGETSQSGSAAKVTHDQNTSCQKQTGVPDVVSEIGSSIKPGCNDISNEVSVEAVDDTTNEDTVVCADALHDESQCTDSVPDSSETTMQSNDTGDSDAACESNNDKLSNTADGHVPDPITVGATEVESSQQSDLGELAGDSENKHVANSADDLKGELGVKPTESEPTVISETDDVSDGGTLSKVDNDATQTKSESDLATTETPKHSTDIGVESKVTASDSEQTDEQHISNDSDFTQNDAHNESVKTDTEDVKLAKDNHKPDDKPLESDVDPEAGIDSVPCGDTVMKINDSVELDSIQTEVESEGVNITSGDEHGVRAMAPENSSAQSDESGTVNDDISVDSNSQSAITDDQSKCDVESATKCTNHDDQMVLTEQSVDTNSESATADVQPTILDDVTVTGDIKPVTNVTTPNSSEAVTDTIEQSNSEPVLEPHTATQEPPTSSETISDTASPTVADSLSPTGNQVSEDQANNNEVLAEEYNDVIAALDSTDGVDNGVTENEETNLDASKNAVVASEKDAANVTPTDSEDMAVDKDNAVVEENEENLKDTAVIEEAAAVTEETPGDVRDSNVGEETPTSDTDNVPSASREEEDAATEGDSPISQDKTVSDVAKEDGPVATENDVIKTEKDLVSKEEGVTSEETESMEETAACKDTLPKETAGVMEVEETTSEPANEDITKDTEPAKDDVTKDTEPAKEDVTKDAEPAKDDITKDTEPIKEDIAKDTDPVKEDVTKDTEPAKEDVNKAVVPTNEDVTKDTEPAKDDVTKAAVPAKDDVTKAAEPAKDDVTKAAEPTNEDVTKAAEPAKEDVAKDTQPAKGDVTKDAEPAKDDVTKATQPSKEDVTKDIEPAKEDVTKDTELDKEDVTKDTEPAEEGITNDTEPAKDVTKAAEPGKEDVAKDTEPTKEDVTKDTEPTKEDVTKDTEPAEEGVTKDTEPGNDVTKAAGPGKEDVTKDTESAEEGVTKDTEPGNDVTKAAEPAKEDVTKAAEPAKEDVTKDTEPAKDDVTKDTQPAQGDVTKDTELSKEDVTRDTEPAKEDVSKAAEPAKEDVTRDTEPAEEGVTKDTEPGNDVTKAAGPGKEDVTKDTESAEEGVTKDTEPGNDVTKAAEPAKEDVTKAAEPAKEDVTKDTEPAKDDVTKDTQPAQGDVTKDTELSKEDVTRDTEPAKEDVSKAAEPAQEDVTKDTEPIKEGVIKNTEPAKEDVTKDTEPAQEDVTKDTEPIKEGVIKNTEPAKEDVTKDTESAGITETNVEAVAKDTESAKEGVTKDTELAKEDAAKAIEPVKDGVAKDTEPVEEGVTTKDAEPAEEDVAKDMEPAKDVAKDMATKECDAKEIEPVEEAVASDTELAKETGKDTKGANDAAAKDMVPAHSTIPKEKQGPETISAKADTMTASVEEASGAGEELPKGSYDLTTLEGGGEDINPFMSRSKLSSTPADSRDEVILPKGAYNLDFLDDTCPDFNPFQTKCRMSHSPPRSSPLREEERSSQQKADQPAGDVSRGYIISMSLY